MQKLQTYFDISQGIIGITQAKRSVSTGVKTIGNQNIDRIVETFNKVSSLEFPSPNSSLKARLVSYIILKSNSLFIASFEIESVQNYCVDHLILPN